MRHYCVLKSLFVNLYKSTGHHPWYPLILRLVGLVGTRVPLNRGWVCGFSCATRRQVVADTLHQLRAVSAVRTPDLDGHARICFHTSHDRICVYLIINFVKRGTSVKKPVDAPEVCRATGRGRGHALEELVTIAVGDP